MKYVTKINRVERVLSLPQLNDKKNYFQIYGALTDLRDGVAPERPGEFLRKSLRGVASVVQMHSGYGFMFAAAARVCVPEDQSWMPDAYSDEKFEWLLQMAVQDWEAEQAKKNK